MSKNSRYRLGTVVIKYGVGSDTIIHFLKDKGYTNVKSSLNYLLTEEEYNSIDNAFSGNLELRQQINRIRLDELTIKTIDLLPLIVNFLRLNEKLRNLSSFKLPWKESEIQLIVKDYFDSIPKGIMDDIHTNNLVDKVIFKKIDKYFSVKEPIPKLELPEYENDDLTIEDDDDDDSFVDGPYCEACMQAPCMCSDRERSSTTFDF